MKRARRYAVAVLVAATVTGGVAVVTPDPLRKLVLLLGVAQVYAVGTAVALRYPDVLWGSSGNWVSGALAGVTTFGTLGLLQGVAGAENFAAAALGWGLAAFGFVAGVAYERESDADGASRDSPSSDESSRGAREGGAESAD